MKKILRYWMLVIGGCLSISLITSCDNSQQEDLYDYILPNNNSYKSITISQASKIALDHYNFAFNSSQTRSINLNISSFEIHVPKSTRCENNERERYYILNFENKMGFAIVSSNPYSPKVYAISDEGELHLSDTTENKSLSWYMNQFLTQTANNIDTTPRDTLIAPPALEKEKEWLSSRMLTGFKSKFHQNTPYNKYCFTLHGQQAKVGCGPLAVGTVMGYFGWPEEHAGYSFDMTSMQKDKEHDGWPRLFEILGRPENLNADYGVSTTGIAGNPYFIARIINNFDYVGTVGEEFKINVVEDQLKRQCPVLVGGWDSETLSRTIGHMWIIDGGYVCKTPYFSTYPDGIDYYKEYYLHCTWGWGGTSNGYFLLHSDNSIGGTPDEYDEPLFSLDEFLFRNLLMVYGMKPNKK